MANGRVGQMFRYDAKGLILSLAILGLVGGAVWFGYIQTFTKGLERLPSKVCDGAVERDVVVRALPSTRTAEEGGSRRNEGDDLTFSCHVYTSADSILTGMVRVNDVSVQQWLDHHGASTGDAIRVSVSGVEALAELDSNSSTSYVYIPCVPRGVRAEDANKSYAIIAEASLIGEGRGSAEALRQTVTDFTYQITKHTYELAECQGPRTLPEELPR